MMPRLILSILALTLAAGAALAADGQAVFQHRDDTMKQLGKPFYLTIGRAAKGSRPIDAETVSAAEAVATTAKSIEPGLFAAGSNVGASKMKPEIFAAPERVAAIIADVRAAVARLPDAAKSGDKATLAAAYAAAADACAACHKAFRTED